MDRDRPEWWGPGLIHGHRWGERSPEGALASTTTVMGGLTTKCLLQDLRVLQQPTAEQQQLVSYAQPQHWPNQEPPAQPGPEDDDLKDDDLDADEPLDEPGEEVEASRSEPIDALKMERRKTNQFAIKVPPSWRDLYASGQKLLREGLAPHAVPQRLGITGKRWREIQEACSITVMALQPDT